MKFPGAGSASLVLDTGAAAPGHIVGVCYVKDQEEDPEFGGIFLRPDCRGSGVASALAVSSLSAYLVEQPPSGSTKLIAHVHEMNQAPRRLLEGLGFEYVCKIKPPQHLVPLTMKRNADGEVVGDEFHYSFKYCSALADSLLTLTRDRRWKPNAAEFELAGQRFETTKLLVTLQALRDIGSGYRSA